MAFGYHILYALWHHELNTEEIDRSLALRKCEFFVVPFDTRELF